jgi:hypothetical protein
MAHNDRFYRPSILAPTWVPTPSQVRRLDQQTSESVNGDEGGTWHPEKPIIIGGAGVRLFGASSITGGVTTGKYAPDGALLLGDSDYPEYVTPRTRTVLFPIVDDYWAAADDNATSQSPLVADYVQGEPGRFQLTKQTVGAAVTSMGLDTKRFPPGATISEVRLCFRVGMKPATVPASLPSFIFTTATAFEQKFLPTPANVDAYFNHGLPQDIVLVPSVLTVVDPTASYFVQLSDGSLTNNIFHSVSVTFTNITSMRPGL